MSEQEPDPEYVRWRFEHNHQIAERHHDREIEFARESNQAAIGNANIALRTLVLVNGGAAVAILAFLGGIVETDTNAFLEDVEQATAPVVSFAWGVALATLGIGLAYFTNYCITTSIWARQHIYEHPYVEVTERSRRWEKWGIFFQVFAVISALASLGCFLMGMYTVRTAVVFLS